MAIADHSVVALKDGVAVLIAKPSVVWILVGADIQARFTRSNTGGVRNTAWREQYITMSARWYSLVFMIVGLLTIGGCYSTAYRPNLDVMHSGSTYAEAQALTSAGQEAQVYVSEHSLPLVRSVKLITFVMAPDFASAEADIAESDGKKFSCRQPIGFWRGINGNAEIDTHLSAVTFGAIANNLYCIPIDGQQCHELYAMCWSDPAAAKRFADSVTALSMATPAERQTGELLSEMIPVNNVSATGQGAAGRSLSPDGATRLVTANNSIKMGDIATAVDIYDRVSQAVPGDAALHFNLALLLAQQGKYGDAIEQMNIYLVLVPHGSKAEFAQSRVLEWQAEKQH